MSNDFLSVTIYDLCPVDQIWSQSGVSQECVFVNSALKLQCQKYTLTDCFFGDFAHWVVIDNIMWLFFLIAYWSCSIFCFRGGSRGTSNNCIGEQNSNSDKDKTYGKTVKKQQNSNSDEDKTYGNFCSLLFSSGREWSSEAD